MSNDTIVMDGSDVNCKLNLASLFSLVLNVFINYSECIEESLLGLQLLLDYIHDLKSS